MWVEGKKIPRASSPPGAAFLFSLSRNPVPEFHTSFDILRFYVSQASLDELSFDRGLRRAAGLNDCLGLQDPVMHGLEQFPFRLVHTLRLRNSFAHSRRVMSGMQSAMARQSPSTVRSAAFRSRASSFENIFSIGLKSGL